MISFQPIFFTTGTFLTALAAFMVAPAVYDWYLGDINWQAFGLSSAITSFSGLLLVFANRSTERVAMTVRDTFLLTAFTWLTVSFFAALPFVFSRSTDTFTDSLFEAISGLTTTGATVIRGVDFASPGVILWRALLQWLGGIGIIVMALTVLPFLRIGGMQLFRSEFSDRSEKVLPKVSQISSAIFGTYLLFTVVCVIALWLAGMTLFEAVSHAMSTISTGGFSTYSTSIEHFKSPLIEAITVVFMIIGSITLLLFVRCFQGDFRSLLTDSQVRAFFLIIVVASLGVTFWLWQSGDPFLSALRHGTFTVVSTITTSGFTSTNYSLWDNFPTMILLMVMMIGGCTGSTTGGVKVFRYQVMYAVTKNQIQQLRRPHGVFLPLYNGKPIPEGIFTSVFAFFGLYVICFALLSLGLAFYDLDLITCLSASAATLNNIGEGLGPIVGPEGSYAFLPNGAKWMIMVGMILGRLEYITILILLSPKFWRD